MHHLKKHDTAFKVVCRENTNDSWSVWANLISKLKSFRQRRYLSKKTGSRSPGRSMWPEPSEIRRLTEQSLLGHTSSIPNPPLRKFPRAVFGLPIIFQFKDRYDRNPNDKSYDPRKTVLQLKTSERFASPLILKPLACQGKAYVGLALILEGEQIEEKDVILKTQKGEKEEWNVSV